MALLQGTFYILRSTSTYISIYNAFVHVKDFFLFKDCISALDGTYIQCKIENANGQQFRNRKGQKSWKILCVVSLNMMFTYVNADWEENSHDMPVLKDSLS